MFGVIFDTNIYGKLFEDKFNGAELAEKIKLDESFLIHNFHLIRNELRRAPKILPLYDGLVCKRVVEEDNKITNLAGRYFEEYKRNGGNVGKNKITSDFKIIACATLLNCDLVFSEDLRTMFSKSAVEAYRKVNLEINRRSPTFYRYDDLKKRFLTGL